MNAKIKAKDKVISKAEKTVSKAISKAKVKEISKAKATAPRAAATRAEVHITKPSVHNKLDKLDILETTSSRLISRLTV